TPRSWGPRRRRRWREPPGSRAGGRGRSHDPSPEPPTTSRSRSPHSRRGARTRRPARATSLGPRGAGGRAPTRRATRGRRAGERAHSTRRPRGWRRFSWRGPPARSVAGWRLGGRRGEDQRERRRRTRRGSLSVGQRAGDGDEHLEVVDVIRAVDVPVPLVVGDVVGVAQVRLLVGDEPVTPVAE